MGSERILFFGIIVGLMIFAAWLIWLRYQDKWRTERLAERPPPDIGGLYGDSPPRKPVRVQYDEYNGEPQPPPRRRP